MGATTTSRTWCSAFDEMGARRLNARGQREKHQQPRFAQRGCFAPARAHLVKRRTPRPRRRRRAQDRRASTAGVAVPTRVVADARPTARADGPVRGKKILAPSRSTAEPSGARAGADGGGSPHPPVRPLGDGAAGRGLLALGPDPGRRADESAERDVGLHRNNRFFREPAASFRLSGAMNRNDALRVSQSLGHQE